MPGTLCAIGFARVKTNEVDARTLADLIPEAWTGDEIVRALSRPLSWRRRLVIRRYQVKNDASAVLHRDQKSLPSLKKCVACAEDR